MTEGQGYIIPIALGSILGFMWVIISRLNTIIELLEGLTRT